MNANLKSKSVANSSMILTRGHEIPDFKPQGNSGRRAVQLKNQISVLLRKLNVHPDDIDVHIERVAIKKAPAKVSWYIGEDYCYYSRQGASFIENLYVIAKVLDIEVQAVLDEREPLEDFLAHFVEEENIEELRVEARKTLEVSEDCVDLEEMKKNYKRLAKAHHPDAGGTDEKFKSLSVAFNILSRELMQ